MNKTAAKKLIDARAAKGYTQTEMADLLATTLKQGYSMRQYQKLEEGRFPKYKKEIVQALDKLLDTNLLEMVYEQEVLQEIAQTFPKSIRQPKIDLDPESDGITYVPISAQAGSSGKLLNPVFTSSLEKLYIPGFPYRGDRYRVWEVEGNSMEPTFKEHFHVLTEKVDHEFWHQIRDYYAYVIVLNDSVLLKRVFKKSPKEWVMISDNEDLYPQFLVPVNSIKEVWNVKRKMDWEMSPPKRFDIKV